MDKTKIVSVGAVLLALALLSFLSADPFIGTGFFSMQAPAEQETILEAQEEQGETERLGARLSYEILKPTTIEAELKEPAVLKDCPEETELEMIVENVGASKAEKVFLEFEQGIKVIGCTNCELDYLDAGKSVVAKAILCLETDNKNAVFVGSANSNLLELLLE